MSGKFLIIIEINEHCKTFLASQTLFNNSELMKHRDLLSWVYVDKEHCRRKGKNEDIHSQVIKI